MRKRIMSLEGARSVFCIIVFIHHFMLAFFPDQPILIYNDGNLAVIFFLLLSGFVAPIRMWNYEESSIDKKMNLLRESLPKRYFRLLPYIAFSILASWMILNGGGVYNYISSRGF